MKMKTNPVIVILTLLTLTSLSCSLVTRVLNPGSETTPTIVAAATTLPSTTAPAQTEPTSTVMATEEKPAPTAVKPTSTSALEEPTPMVQSDEPPLKVGQLMRQWATAAEATSEYDNPEWSAQQAVGAPDTLACGDAPTAWASAVADGVESITLYYYNPPLIPAEINIVQSYNPSQVVKVEVIDASGGNETVVYEGEPQAMDECPYTLSIPVSDIDYLVMGVRITLDQSVLDLGWNEIDAVELVGYPQADFEPQPTPADSGENVWENIYALPIFSSAENVNYQDDQVLSYTVSDSTRQDVLDFVFAELGKIGWQLDVDEEGNCRDEDRCMSKLAGLDYAASDNALWFFIHSDSTTAVLTLTLIESSGLVVVGMAIQ